MCSSMVRSASVRARSCNSLAPVMLPDSRSLCRPVPAPSFQALQSGGTDAINASNAQFTDSGGAPCAPGAAGVPCAINAGATIGSYAGNGLGSSDDMGGNSCLFALGYNCAFGGINPNAPPLAFLSP